MNRLDDERQAAVEQYHNNVYGRVGDVLGNVTVVQSYARLGAEMQAMRSIMADLLTAQYPVLTWWGLLTVLTRTAATTAYEAARIGPEDLDLVELHDCCATAELVHYDNLGLCEQGGAVDFFHSGAPWRDGRLPVNVSGGLQSKGHPISATGIANIWEVCHHLRGEAGDRQIEGAQVGLAHVIGLGSACGVHILEKAAA